MARTNVVNNPAIDLLAAYPGGIGSKLTASYVQCDPANGNYFTATNRDLVTFIALPAASAPAYNAAITYTVGQVVTQTGVQYIAIASVPLATPPPNASFWAVYTSSTLTVLSAPDSCTGRTADVVNYAIPVFDAVQQTVEFLVLPSSTFTQANGQVQFTASSNLVYVYVRNL